MLGTGLGSRGESREQGERAGKGRLFGSVRALLLGVVLLVLVNAVVLFVAVEMPEQGWQIRGLHHLFDAGQHLGVGLCAAVGLAACGKLGLRYPRNLLLLAAFSFGIGALTLVEDASGFAHRLVPSAPGLGLWLVVTIVSGAVVLAAVVGRFSSRPWLRWGTALVGVAAMAVNHFILPDDYPGAHLFMAIAAVTLVASAFAGAPLPTWWPRVQRALPWTLASLFAASTLAIPPGNTLLLNMLRLEGAVVTPFLARMGAAGSGGDAHFPLEWEPWLRDRATAKAVSPTDAAILPEDGIVILLTIDSLRADVLADRRHDDRLPNLAALRDESVSFTEARAPGSQTVYTLAQMFMGTYYSMQYWTEIEGERDLWPHEDETRRFPEILAEAGVATANFATAKWLVNRFGIVRGFTEDEFVEPKRTRYTLTSRTIPKVIERLEQHRGGRLFIYTHALDAHFTVSPKKKKAEPLERYLANLELADARLGELRKAIERLGLSDRVVLIVSSDHGEAFGEHDTHHHRSTLYDELLRVPLIVHGPGIRKGEVDVPVTLMDLGPTILDLFGQPTPGHFMGQTLVPLLVGKKHDLKRPIAAEGRLKKALLFPDGYKAIVDDRHNTAEVYDLGRDREEAHNLLDSSQQALRRVQVLRMFFDTHEIRREGYSVPYRP